MLSPVARKMLVEHLRHELDMLEAAFEFLHAPHFEKDRLDKFRKNAAIEVFWLHARCLVYFFDRKQNNSDEGEASADDFTTNPLHYELPARATFLGLFPNSRTI